MAIEQDLASELLGPSGMPPGYGDASPLAAQALASLNGNQRDLAAQARATLARINPSFGGGPDQRTAALDEFDMQREQAAAGGAPPMSPASAADAWQPGTPFTNAPGFKPVPVVGGPTPAVGQGVEPAPPRAPTAGPARGGGPAGDQGTSPLDVVRAMQAESGAGTPGTSSSGSSRSVTQGVKFTPEQRQELGAGQQRFDAQVNDIADARQTQYAAQLGDMRAREVAMASQRQRQQEIEDQRQALVDKRTAGQEAALKDYQEGKPPEPFGGSWAAGLLATLGQALGAYGAGRTGTPNFAMQMVNGYLDRQQKQWEAEQLKKRFGVEAARDLTREAREQFTDAKTDRQMTERMIADAELQRLQAGERNVDKQQQIQMIRAENSKQYDQLRLQMEREAQDRVTVSTHSASTGGAPGRRTSLLDASADAVKKGLITPEEGRAVRGQGNAADAEGRSAAEQTIKGSSDALLDAASTYLPQMGASVDPKTGEWKIGTGSLVGSRVPLTTAKHAREALINTLAPDIASNRKKGNATPSDEEVDGVRKELSTLSPESFAMTINTAVKRAHAVKNQKILHSKRQVSGGDQGDE